MIFLQTTEALDSCVSLTPSLKPARETSADVRPSEESKEVLAQVVEVVDTLW